MSPRRVICVSHDGGVCALVGRALAAAGLTVEHVRELPADTAGAVLVVADRAARRAAGEGLRSQPVPVVVVGDDLDDDGLISLMHEAPISHLVEDPGDRTLEVTSEKLATGDVWGLEKYLAPGARVRERVVHDERGTRRAMDEVSAWAEAVGARRGAVHRIANVVDELLMNALIADAAAGGAGARRAVLRWASDERTLAISVLDDSGALSQRDLIDHVRRARLERGRPQSPLDGDEAGGAGLGLYLVLANVAGLVVNVAPGRRTEVVCLFDLAPANRRPVARTRSLHVFAGA